MQNLIYFSSKISFKLMDPIFILQISGNTGFTYRVPFFYQT